MSDVRQQYMTHHCLLRHPQFPDIMSHNLLHDPHTEEGLKWLL